MRPSLRSAGQRIRILCLILVLGLISYVLARSCAPAIIEYVVEETLVQKAPHDVDPAVVRARLAAALAARADRDTKLEFLLDVARSLEKYQKLTPQEIDRLLPAKPPAAEGIPFRNQNDPP